MMGALVRRVTIFALACAALFVGPASAEKAHVGPPNSLVLIGHSGGTGFNSDPSRPEQDVLENSWATGTNLAVNSVYLRLLAANPAIRGHNVNLARDGARIGDIWRQALAATRLKLKPELVLIQTIVNDISCDPSQDQAALVAQFRATFMNTVRALSRGLPNARIFVTSVLGRPLTYAQSIQNVPEAVAANTGTGPCDLFDEAGNIVLAHVNFVTGIIESYERAEAEGCAGFVHCRYDGGAMASGVDKLEYVGLDWGHPSVAGHAWAAQLAWSAMFDFADATAPASQASKNGRRVALSATDAAGGAGIEYKLTAPKKKPAKWFTRYTKPVAVKKKWTLTWRAVDVNGNSEATHTLRG